MLILVLFILAVLISGVVGLFKLLAAPMKLVFKLLLNALFGFLVLFIVNFIASYAGFYLHYTLLNSIIVGLLGVPGVIILIVLKLLFLF